MKKLYKFTAMLIAGIISCPLTGVMADELVVDGWKINCMDADEGMCMVEIAEGEGYTGENAIKLVNKFEEKQTGADIRVTDVSGFSAGEYTFEFYAKGDFNAKGISAGFGTNANPKTGSFFALNNKKFTVEEGEDGWTKYSININYTVGDEVHINAAYGCNEVYIDDISIYGADGVNLVKNNSFETYEIVIPEPPMSGIAKNWNNAGSYIVTNQDSYSGKSSLYMVNGGTDMNQTINLVGGTLYDVSMYLKVEPTPTHKWMCKVFIGNEDPKSIGELGANVQHMNDKGWKVTETEKPGWYKFEAQYSPALGSPLIHIRSQGTDASMKVWIDDIVVYDVADEEKTNLVTNGGFEDYTLPEITDLTVEKTGYREVTAKWTNPALRGSAINVFVNDKKVDSADLSAASAAVNSVVIPDVVSGETYDIKIGITYGSVEMTTEESVTVEDAEYEISDFEFNYGEANVVEGGNSVTVKMTNYAEKEKFAELMLVARKGDMIVGVDSKKFSSVNGEETIAKATINLPDISDGDYTVTAYLWDDFEDMGILIPNTVYTEAEVIE